METRVSVINIVIDTLAADVDTSQTINTLLHDAGVFVVGRMGIPYREKHVNIINIVIDAPQNVTSTLAGRLGKLKGVSVKATYTNVITSVEEQKNA